MAKIKVTVSGPKGSGKSAIAWLIEVALSARRLGVSYEDNANAHGEQHTDGYRLDVFETRQPSVILVEKVERPGEKPLNHDLLERALSLLVHEAISFAECSCQCATDGTPLPGTCLPEAVEDLEGYLQLIRDIESEVGPTTEPEPEWFEDLIDRRWSLTEKAGEA